MDSKEGFWYSKYEPSLPMPVGNDKPWNGQREFVLKLKKKQETARCRAYKGSSMCRICNEHNGSEEFSTKEWTWPQGLLHYIEEHNVEPSLAFQEMINKG